MSITEIKIKGDSDQVYTIELSKGAAKCSCPAYRYGVGPCKHMKYVVAQMRNALVPA
jgi:uncharacterized Zn finger protein